MILIATSSSEHLIHWRQGTIDFDPVYCVHDFNTLRHELERSKPQVILLDNELPTLSSSLEVLRLAKSHPDTRIIILSPELAEDTEWELFKAGARGFCKKDIDPSLLKRVIIAVQKGELWIRRTFTNRLLAELEAMEYEKNMMRQSVSNLLANLTERENEIVTLVGNGESNKQIAIRLEISERTVKAHLTEIFKKLNVADRLNLALLVSGTIISPRQQDVNKPR